MACRLKRSYLQLSQWVWVTDDDCGTNPRTDNTESYNFQCTLKNEASCNSNSYRSSSDYNSFSHFHSLISRWTTCRTEASSRCHSRTWNPILNTTRSHHAPRGNDTCIRCRTHEASGTGRAHHYLEDPSPPRAADIQEDFGSAPGSTWCRHRPTGIHSHPHIGIGRYSLQSQSTTMNLLLERSC